MKKILLAVALICTLSFSLSACNVAYTPNKPNKKSEITSKTEPAITEQAAKETALNHAGVNEADIYDYDADYDTDIGEISWEIEFKVDKYEYSYDIDAATGEIINSHKEIDY